MISLMSRPVIIGSRSEEVTTKPENLTIAQVGELMFDFLKIKPEVCEGVAI